MWLFRRKVVPKTCLSNVFWMKTFAHLPLEDELVAVTRLYIYLNLEKVI